MNKKYIENHALTSKIWIHRVLIIGVLGLLIYVLSYPITEQLGSETTLAKFSKDIGIALVISTIVALALERLVHESLLNNVDNALETMMNSSDVLRGAAEMGIEDILARREPNIRKRWELRVKNAIEEQILKKSGEILIACVAAPEFFRQGDEIGSLLWNGISRPENNCTLKVLLLCPNSKWATLRATLEPGHPVIFDIESSAKCLHNFKENLKTNKRDNKIQFRCYDFPPIAFLVITESLMFIDPYPMIKVEPGKGPIGGWTPMLLVRKDTETYKRWKAHFEYIWKEQSNDYEKHHANELNS